MRTSILLTFVFVAAACDVERVPNPNFDAGRDAESGSGGSGGTGGTSGSGGTGGGDLDAGEDSGMDAGVDASPCPLTCDGTTPHCDVASMTCVACLETSDCASPAVCKTNGHACVACNTDTECATNITNRLCATDNTCVECLADTDCNGPTEAKCNLTTHQCVPCDSNEQCEGISGLSVCDDTDGTGECVECTVTDETACSGNSCDPATNECTTTPLASVGTCGRCLADSECANAEARCVPMTFQGNPREGGYCLRRKGSTDCLLPFGTLLNAVSLSGVASQDYCGVAQSLTTCEATLDMIAATDCGGDNAVCGVPNLDDGLCRSVGGFANKCTYACDDASQCSGSRTCTVDDPYCH